jgi:hypothetical protein
MNIEINVIFKIEKKLEITGISNIKIIEFCGSSHFTNICNLIKTGYIIVGGDNII